MFEAAKIAGLEPETIRAYAREGRIKARRFGKVYVIEPKDLKAFLAIPRPRGRPRKKQGS